MKLTLIIRLIRTKGRCFKTVICQLSDNCCLLSNNLPLFSNNLPLLPDKGGLFRSIVFVNQAPVA